MNRIVVAAAAIIDADGKVLISLRAANVHQGGLWEFPGGKVEAGESRLEALDRELYEELGIHVEKSEPLIQITHAYPEKTVVLDVYKVTAYRGRAVGREGQPVRWVFPSEMDSREFPAADVPIITALRLPDSYLITGNNPENPVMFLRRLEAALRSGVPMVQLRAPSLSAADYRGLARAAAHLCKENGSQLILNTSPENIEGFKHVGLHLNRHRLMALDCRPCDSGVLVGASCHSQVELDQACRLGLDYALLSPVNMTASHPESVPLGWDGFAEWVADANIPIYALGGMLVSDVSEAKRRGGQGIAAIRAFWPADRT